MITLGCTNILNFHNSDITPKVRPCHLIWVKGIFENGVKKTIILCVSHLLVTYVALNIPLSENIAL